MSDAPTDTTKTYGRGKGRPPLGDDARAFVLTFRLKPEHATRLDAMSNAGESRNQAARRLLLEVLNTQGAHAGSPPHPGGMLLTWETPNGLEVTQLHTPTAREIVSRLERGGWCAIPRVEEDALAEWLKPGQEPAAPHTITDVRGRRVGVLMLVYKQN